MILYVRNNRNVVSKNLEFCHFTNVRNGSAGEFLIDVAVVDPRASQRRCRTPGWIIKIVFRREQEQVIFLSYVSPSQLTSELHDIDPMPLVN